MKNMNTDVLGLALVSFPTTPTHVNFINNMQKRHYIAAALLISTLRSLMQVMAGGNKP